MAKHIPSKQTLRFLARVCATEHSGLSRCPLPCAAARHNRPTLKTASRRALSTTTTSKKPLTDTSPSSPHPTTPPPAQPLPDTTSYYTLFPSTLPTGPPPTGPFAIDTQALRREFLRLQALYHPDKHSSATPSVHLPATSLIALSSLINNAYKTLSSPLLRAQYLLDKLYGIDVTSEDNSANTTNPTTLMEVMEAQESIESASGQEEIDELKTSNQSRIEETSTKMGRSFEDGDVDSARRECIRLKYWMSLQEGLEGWEDGKEVRLVH